MFFHFESENKDSFGLQWLFTMEELKGDTTLGVFSGQGGVQGRVFEDIDF